MNWNYTPYSKTDNKHKVFISYYHKDDSYYRERFESLFGHLFMNTSVKPGDIDTDDSDEYIKRLIQEDYISDNVKLLQGKAKSINIILGKENKKIGTFLNFLNNGPSLGNFLFCLNFVKKRIILKIEKFCL